MTDFTDPTGTMNELRKFVIAEIKAKVLATENRCIDVSENGLDMVVADKSYAKGPYGHRGVLLHVECPENWTDGICFQFESFNVSDDSMSVDDLTLILDSIKSMNSDAEAMFKADLKKMPVEKLVEMFNEYVTDVHRFRFSSIMKMDDEDNWDELRQYLGMEKFITVLSDAIRDNGFNQNNEYWLYDEDACRLYSFTTRTELFGVIPVQAFADTFRDLDFSYENITKGENELTYWADIKKCGLLVAKACIVLPISVSANMVFYKDGKPDYCYELYMPKRPTNWKQEDFFKDAVRVLNDELSFIPWQQNRFKQFHTK